MTNLTALVGELEAMLAKATDPLPAKGEGWLDVVLARNTARMRLDKWGDYLPHLLATLKAQRDTLEQIVMFAPDVGVDQFHDALRRARASIEGNPTA